MANKITRRYRGFIMVHGAIFSISSVRRQSGNDMCRMKPQPRITFAPTFAERNIL